MSRPWSRCRGLRGAGALLVALCSGLPCAWASWPQVVDADARLDLVTARAAALDTVASDPSSPSALAAAAWWLRNLDSLPDPDQLTEAVDGERDPELAWILSKIDGTLRGRPPAVVLATGEVAGPFGVFDTLDLERDTVPDDARLPAVGTRWTDPSTPFRLLVRSMDGWMRPPESMIVRGVYLVAWSVRAA